jgi:predicted ATPase
VPVIIWINGGFGAGKTTLAEELYRRDQAARELGMTGVDGIVAAAARQPGGTLILRSDRLTPAELADEVLARAGLRQVRADGKPMRQARPLDSNARCSSEPGVRSFV